ncbi:MAG TPA: alpha/beta fold hydrolase [Methylomirabilota bacterium]|nr:alpha/beta fold hydrolase [Methylomirabilota bacterium]
MIVGMLLVGLLALASPAVAASRTLGPGDHALSVKEGQGKAARTRTFLVHVPRAVTRGVPLPVLVAFHGGGGNATGFQKYAGLDRIADREGVIVIYPDGTGPAAGRRLLTWNAGECCGHAQQTHVDDVGFTLAILKRLAGELPIDPARVYVTGHSNGAMMAYRMAAEAAEHIAAVAVVAGMMAVGRFAPAQPVPVLHIHSVDDPRALYRGGLGPPFPGTDVRSPHPSVEGGLARWVIADRCATEPQVADTRHGSPDRGGHTAELLVHEPCETDAVVAHWKLTGAGHGWPGHASPLPERVMGPDTDVIDAAEEIWKFVSRFRRPDAPPLR